MKHKTISLWAYVITGIILLLFVAPALISAADTVAVLFGVVLLVLYGTWSWRLIVEIFKNKELVK